MGGAMIADKVFATDQAQKLEYKYIRRAQALGAWNADH